MLFQICSPFQPTGDQPQAIQRLAQNLKQGVQHQTLLGATGSGKTFTMANVIYNTQRPALIISHNKTLAAQLANEFQRFFPHNRVHYFVSYYDYYQPESYLPQTDTYIEKQTQINEEIDRLRHAATQSLLSYRDTIIVASVSCIYGLGSPQEYQAMSEKFKLGEKQSSLKEILTRLTQIQYQRNDTDFPRGSFRLRGDSLEIHPASTDEIIKVNFFGDEIEKITRVDYLTHEPIEDLNEVQVFPAKHWLMSKKRIDNFFTAVKKELKERIKFFKEQKKILEAHRIEQKTKFDLEMIQETGCCNGIENYSRYLSGRAPGEPPFTLLDYFPRDFLVFIDESHITLPQIKGMYRGDYARKKTLVDYGFRLPSALDNRPLKFNEFKQKIKQTIYVSATPAEYEIKKSLNCLNKKSSFKSFDFKNQKTIVQQLIRPTGLLDPEIEVRPIDNQIQDTISEIQKRINKNQRVLITTLTKKMAETLAGFLKEKQIKVHYLHSEINTLKRLEILKKLRKGKYDVVVGVNLLREGLDLPEVSLVIILDADKEGFLRSNTALLQTIGRAARHKQGKVIMFADNMTRSMKEAIHETRRRRKIQMEYNKKYKIKPRSITKEIKTIFDLADNQKKTEKISLKNIPQNELKRIIQSIKKEMELAAQNLEFEKAAQLRDKLQRLNNP